MRWSFRMKKDMKRLKIVCIYVSVCLCTALALPVASRAQGSSTDTLYLNKTATYDYATHMGEITLESFIPGEMQVVQEAKAIDVVLLLDNSGSMTYGKRYTKLITAVKIFLNLMSQNAVENNVDHKVSIIAFGGKNYPFSNYTTPSNGNFLKEVGFNDKISGHTGSADNDYVTYNTCVIKRFCSIKDNINSLNTIMDSFRPCGGNTMTDNGFELTSLMFNHYGRTGDNIAKIVILFSDGQPSMDGATGWYDTSGSMGALEHKGGFRVAVPALQKAKSLKSSGTTIYSVYCSNSSPDSNTTKFMDGCSSDYPNAEFSISYSSTQATTSGGKWKLGTQADTKYYTNAEDSQENLNRAFENIAEDIKVEVNTKYNDAVTMKDFVNNNYFQFPENSTVDDIRVYEQLCTGYDSVTGEYTFSSTLTDITSSVGVALTRAQNSSEHDLVEIYNYDYSANWCGMDISVSPAVPHGAKLVVKLPFTFKGGLEVSGALNTNTSNSGIYLPQIDETTQQPIRDPDTGKPIAVDTPEWTYISPQLKFCTVTITRSNLDPNENAVYDVSDKDGNFVCRVALVGIKDQDTVSKSIYGLPGDTDVTYTVTETNWNWAYSKDGSASQTKEVSNPSQTVVFPFSGSHLNGTGSDPAEKHNHDEKHKRNIMILSN